MLGVCFGVHFVLLFCKLQALPDTGLVGMVADFHSLPGSSGDGAILSLVRTRVLNPFLCDQKALARHLADPACAEQFEAPPFLRQVASV